MISIHMNASSLLAQRQLGAAHSSIATQYSVKVIRCVKAATLLRKMPLRGGVNPDGVIS